MLSVVAIQNSIYHDQSKNRVLSLSYVYSQFENPCHYRRFLDPAEPSCQTDPTSSWGQTTLRIPPGKLSKPLMEDTTIWQEVFNSEKIYTLYSFCADNANVIKGTESQQKKLKTSFNLNFQDQDYPRDPLTTAQTSWRVLGYSHKYYQDTDNPAWDTFLSSDKLPPLNKLFWGAVWARTGCQKSN